MCIMITVVLRKKNEDIRWRQKLRKEMYEFFFQYDKA